MLGNNLDAAGMMGYYQAAIARAIRGPTFSPEFHFVRDDPAGAMNLLINGGLTVAAAQAFTQQFGVEVQRQGVQNEEHVDANVQEQIMNALGVHQEQLFAIIRYLQHQGVSEQEQREQNTTSGEPE